MTVPADVSHNLEVFEREELQRSPDQKHFALYMILHDVEQHIAGKINDEQLERGRAQVMQYLRQNGAFRV